MEANKAVTGAERGEVTLQKKNTTGNRMIWKEGNGRGRKIPIRNNISVSFCSKITLSLLVRILLMASEGLPSLLTRMPGEGAWLVFLSEGNYND